MGNSNNFITRINYRTIIIRHKALSISLSNSLIPILLNLRAIIIRHKGYPEALSAIQKGS